MPSDTARDPRVAQSLRHSVRDGVAYAFMAGAGESYLAAYALFLKATTAQISVLTALPALLGSVAQLLSAWLGGHIARRQTLILAGVLGQALAWLPIIWLPYFFPEHAVAILIGSVALYYAGANLASPMWTSLMGDLVPERRRGRFFGRRTRIMSLTAFLSMVGAGLWLHYFELHERTRLGFMTVFSVALLARLYSFYQLTRMHEPVRARAPMRLPALHTLATRLRHSHFVRFSVFVACLNFAVAIASPFFTVYMLRDLQFSYLEFTASTGVSVLMQFATLRLWGRLGDIFGNRLILVMTGALIPLLPSLWLVSSSFWYILAVQMLGGLCWAGFSLSAGNFLYDVVTPEKRAGYLALHNMLGNAGVFGGALVGGFLSTVIPAEVVVFGLALHWTSGLWGVLLISTVARAAMVLVFLPRLREVRAVRQLSPMALLTRLFRLPPFLGGTPGLLGRRPRPAPAAPETRQNPSGEKT
jgi:MFS family permease